jgi:hypothetical protein
VPDDSENGMPSDPVTGLGSIAAMHHEWYLAWQEAGFTEPQAFDLVKVAISSAFRSG